MKSFEKCKKIYDDLVKKYRTAPILDKDGEDTGIKKYIASAREIEVDIYNMRCNDEISQEEYYCIFGMICKDALYFGGTDFYRA